MSNQQMNSLFGTPIALVEIKENTDILQSSTIGFNPTYNQPELWRSSSVSENMRVLESYPQIKKILLDTFISFSSEILGLNCNFEIITSWLTKCEKGESCPFHLHGNSFWSGIYY